MDIAVWVIVALIVLWWLGRRSLKKEQEKAAQQQARADDILADSRRTFAGPSDGPSRTSRSAPTMPPRPMPSKPTPVKKTTSPARWLSAGDDVTVSGIHIPGGMIYVGHTRHSHDRRELIDPNLPVRPCHSLSRAPELSYWPNYAYLEPEARGAYLRWLAQGRRAPEIDVGYVFLFFYGLERRLFLDKAHQDAPALIAEVERLQGIYGDNHSFRRYSEAFLNAARVVTAQPTHLTPPEPTTEWSGELPAAVRLGIGMLLSQDRPVPSDWMLAWYLGHEDTRLRTPAQRAFQEFRTLFERRFDRAYPDGMKVSRPKGRMTLDFHPASRDFHADLTPAGLDIPDISRLKAPVRKAAAIAETCMDDLDSYSRLLGREPEAVGSLKALALLPADLRDAVNSPEVTALTAWLADLAGDRPATLPVDDLLVRLGLAEQPLTTVGKPLARSLAQSLRLLGYGLDPDVDMGASTPKPGDVVAVYRLPDAAPAEGAFGHAFASAAAVVGVTALVIHADDVVTPEEEAHLLQLVEDNLHLCPAERAHLQARALRLLAAPPTLAQMRARLKDATANERHHLARFALAVAAADGHVAPAEVKLLEGVYKHLDLDRDQLYGDIHALGGQTADEPVVVRPARSGPADHAIPAPPTPFAPAAAGIALNMAHVERVRGDTQEVSALLSDIFGAEEPEPPEPEKPLSAAEGDAADGPSFDGLDRRHASLLSALLDREAWPRADFEHLCRGLDLLPDGAMEALNEWAFDTLDDPILEDDEPITLNRHLLAPQDPMP